MPTTKDAVPDSGLTTGGAVPDKSVQKDIETIGHLDAVHTALKVLRQTTGMRIALVARVTADSWTACAVLDDAGLGLKPGDQMDLSTTY